MIPPRVRPPSQNHAGAASVYAFKLLNLRFKRLLENWLSGILTHWSSLTSKVCHETTVPLNPRTFWKNSSVKRDFVTPFFSLLLLLLSLLRLLSMLLMSLILSSGNKLDGWEYPAKNFSITIWKERSLQLTFIVRHWQAGRDHQIYVLSSINLISIFCRLSAEI